MEQDYMDFSGHRECFLKAVLDVIISNTPIIEQAKELYEKTKQNIVDYNNDVFFRKLYVLWEQTKDISKEQKQTLLTEIEEKNGDGNVLISYIDKYETLKKIEILGKMFKDSCNNNNDMDSSMFLRMAKIIDSVPYSDFDKLEMYKIESEAKDDGSTEILFASGVLKLSYIPLNQENGELKENKYKLSSAGVKLLSYYKNDFHNENKLLENSKGGTTASTISWQDGSRPISLDEINGICE